MRYLTLALVFVLNERNIGAVYACDLTGAGAGALMALALMALVHPFRLVPCLLPVLAPLPARPTRRCTPDN